MLQIFKQEQICEEKNEDGTSESLADKVKAVIIENFKQKGIENQIKIQELKDKDQKNNYNHKDLIDDFLDLENLIEGINEQDPKFDSSKIIFYIIETKKIVLIRGNIDNQQFQGQILDEGDYKNQLIFFGTEIMQFYNIVNTIKDSNFYNMVDLLLEKTSFKLKKDGKPIKNEQKYSDVGQGIFLTILDDKIKYTSQYFAYEIDVEDVNLIIFISEIENLLLKLQDLNIKNIFDKNLSENQKINDQLKTFGPLQYKDYTQFEFQHFEEKFKFTFPNNSLYNLDSFKLLLRNIKNDFSENEQQNKLCSFYKYYQTFGNGIKLYDIYKEYLNEKYPQKKSTFKSNRRNSNFLNQILNIKLLES